MKNINMCEHDCAGTGRKECFPKREIELKIHLNLYNSHTHYRNDVECSYRGSDFVRNSDRKGGWLLD